MTSPKLYYVDAAIRDQIAALLPSSRPSPKGEGDFPPPPWGRGRGEGPSYSTNKELTELSSQILRIVSAISSATLMTRIFDDASASGFNGMVSVTTSSSITEASMRLTAWPDNTGCVQYATTRSAPCSFNASAAAHSVFAVSTMS